MFKRKTISIYLLFDFQLSPREERGKKCTFHPLLQKAVEIESDKSVLRENFHGLVETQEQ